MLQLNYKYFLSNITNIYAYSPEIRDYYIFLVYFQTNSAIILNQRSQSKFI